MTKRCKTEQISLLPTKDSTTQKESPAQYAQRRRDREAEAREALKALLPIEAFDQTIEARNDLNITSKILVAAKMFIECQQMQKSLSGQSPILETSKSPRSSGDRNARVETPNTSIPFQIPTIVSSDIAPNQEIRYLRQVAQRMIHKAEENIATDGSLTFEFQKMLSSITDRMIQEIFKIEEIM